MTIYYALTEARNADAVLARMLRQVFECSEVHHTDKGKPFGRTYDPFSFSLSGSLAVLLADESECGVDAEPLDSEVMEEPEAFLTAGELVWLQDQVHNVMTLWTRKNAACKAAGNMAIPMRSIDVLARDNSVTLDGVRYYLGSYALKGHVVSWASRRFAIPELQLVKLDQRY